jgi:hypothetical protein
MGLLSIIFGSGKDRVLNSDNENAEIKKRKKHSILDAALGTGDYAKTPEEKEEVRASRTLPVRLGNLKIKKYKNSRLPQYNNKKNRLEVGEDFDFRTLPNLIYSTAKRNYPFRGSIGGRFSIHDRDALKIIMNNNRYKVSQVKRKLNHRDENRCVASLNDLF